MTARIRLRRADYGNWLTDNPTLDHGEIGLIYDTVPSSGGKETIVGWVVGNGAEVWSALPINRPPTAGTRTGLDDGDGAENGGLAPVSYDDIALLALDNTFTPGQQVFGPATTPASQTPLTVKGKLTVTESSSSAADGDLTVSAGDVAVTAGDVTVTAGDVTLVNGELTVPLHADGDPTARDTNAIRGASTTKGGIVFDTSGVRIGNSGVAAGKLRKADFSEWGPNILVKSDKIVVGGYDSATTLDANKTTLEYAAAPAGKTDIEDLDDLVVPTALQVITHVTENTITAGVIHCGVGGTGQVSGTGALDYNASSFEFGRLAYQLRTITKASWASRYLRLVIHIRWDSSNDPATDVRFRFRCQDSAGANLIGAADGVGGPIYRGDSEGHDWHHFAQPLVMLAPLLADGTLKLSVQNLGSENRNQSVQYIEWLGSTEAFELDQLSDID